MKTRTTAFIEPGALLVMPGTLLPQNASMDLRRMGPWHVFPDATKTEAQLREAGWHLFFVVPSISERAVAVDAHAAVDAAVRSILAKVGELKVNAFEVTALNVRRVLGLHVAQVTAQPRHVRPDAYASPLLPHRWLVDEPAPKTQCEPLQWPAAA